MVSEQPLSEGERWRLGLGGMVQLAVTLAGVRVVRSRLRTRPALQGTGAGTAPTSRAPAQGRSGGAVSIDWLEHDPNRVHHIMAAKHAWNRIVRLSGDMLQDYRAVQPYIEQVIRSGTVEVADTTPKGPLVKFTATVKGEQAVVTVIQIGNNVFEISNAWVQTRGQTP